MAIVRLDCDRITDWETFHTVFAEAFGFPDYYGRNMNAWIDCMGYLDEPGSGMTSVTVETGDFVTLQLDGIDAFVTRCPEQYEAIVDRTAFVNWRRTSEGLPGVLALSFYRTVTG